MEITLANERAFQLQPKTSFADARVLVQDKKTGLVAGTMGMVLSRPKPDDILLAYAEQRWEPFWQVVIHSRTVYERTAEYTFRASGEEVQRVSVLGQTLQVDPKLKGGPGVRLGGIEHCEEDRRQSATFDGISGKPQSFEKQLQAPAVEIPDLEAFRPEEAILVPPEARATAVVRQLMAETVRPVKAQTIHQETVAVEAIDLFFHPVYAFEFRWATKDKQVIVEFDGVTGETGTGGKTLKDAVKNVFTRDVIFDVTADAVGMLVPGGSIAVKLVKAVVDRGK